MKNELFEFFTSDNTSGKKCTEKWLSKNNEKLYSDIIKWSNNNNLLIEFKRKIYHYINELMEIPKCDCGNFVKYKNLKLGYCKCCSNKCSKNSNSYKQNWRKTWKENNSDNSFINTRVDTIIKKYGNLKNYNKIINETKEKNLIKNFGVINVFQLNDVKERSKKIKLEKYGNEYWNNSNKTREIRIKNGTQIDDSLIDDFIKYKKIVVNRSNTIYRNNKKIINPTDLEKGIKKYHLDHKYSIKQGFLNNIPIEIITHPCNLYMMWWKDNIKKQDRCDITLNELLNNILIFSENIIIKTSFLNDLYQKNKIEKIIKEMKYEIC